MGAAVVASAVRTFVVACALLVLGAPSAAAAPPPPRYSGHPHFGHPETLRPDLRAITSRHYERKRGRATLSLRSIQIRRYDKAGRLRSNRYYRPARGGRRGRTWLSWTYRYDAAGRLTSSTYRDHEKGRRQLRRYRYALDTKGRVTRCTARFGKIEMVDTISYDRAGGYTVRTSRLHGGARTPAYSGFERYDARGRRTRRCSSTGCQLYEHDKHGNVRRVRVHPRRSRHRGHHWYRVYKTRTDAKGRPVDVTVGGSRRLLRYNKRGDLVERTTLMMGKKSGRTLSRYAYR